MLASERAGAGPGGTRPPACSICRSLDGSHPSQPILDATTVYVSQSLAPPSPRLDAAKPCISLCSGRGEEASPSPSLYITVLYACACVQPPFSPFPPTVVAPLTSRIIYPPPVPFQHLSRSRDPADPAPNSASLNSSSIPCRTARPQAPSSSASDLFGLPPASFVAQSFSVDAVRRLSDLRCGRNRKFGILIAQAHPSSRRWHSPPQDNSSRKEGMVPLPPTVNVSCLTTPSYTAPG